MPEGWRLVAVDWHEETVDATWLVADRGRRVTGPVHLKVKAYDKRSLCGIKDPEPYGLVQWASEHRYPVRSDTWDARCVTCFERAGLIDIPGRD